MPIIYAPTTYLVSMIWESANFASGNGATVLGFNGPAATSGTMLQLAITVNAQWQANLRAQMDSDYTLASVRVESDVSSLEQPFNNAGTRASSGSPSNVALIRFKKALGKGRRNAGRNFWPGFLSNSEVDERGTILVSRLTTLTTSFNAFFDGVEAGPDGPWVESIPQAVTEESLSTPIVPWPTVQTSGLRPVIGTQRRRVRP